MPSLPTILVIIILIKIPNTLVNAPPIISIIVDIKNFSFFIFSLYIKKYDIKKKLRTKDKIKFVTNYYLDRL